MPAKPFPWKYLNLVALVLFIGFNVLIRVKENQMGDDTRMQFANAQAWRQGYGVSLLYADPTDLARVAPRVVEFWPPGYALFAGTALHFTDNLELVHWLVDSLGFVLFFGGWFLIGRRLIPFTAPYFPALLMLTWGFGYVFKWFPTVDFVAMSWHVFGMACLVEWIARGEGSRRTGWLIASGLAAFGACFFRFAYYLLTFVPAGVLLTGALLGNRRWWRPGLGLLAFTALLVGAQVLYQHYIAGSVNYLTQRHAGRGDGIHWYNLKQFTTFVTQSIPGSSLLRMPELASDIMLAVLVLAGTAGVTWAARRLEKPARQVVYGWLGLTWGSFVLNIAFLVFLSLRYPPESWGPWTYVQEIRYFALNMVTVGAMVVFLACWKGTPVPRFLRYVQYGVVIFIGAHAYAYASFKHRVHESITPSEPFTTAEVVYEQVRKAPGPVVFATDQVNNYWDVIPMTSMGIFGAMGGAAIIKADALVQSPRCSEPVTVLVAIVNAPPPGLDSLYSTYNARQVGTVGIGFKEGIPLMQFTLPATAGRTDSRAAR
jgi:hypothetical protein